MATKRKKISPDFESLQRRIARRIKAGLPLAGMIAATTLLSGCHEHSENFPAGSVPRDPSLCEQQNEKSKPKVPAPANKNGRNETENDLPAGDVEPPNRNNETVDPASTRGRFPAKRKDK